MPGERCLERGAVERVGRLGADALDRPALHEQALATIERRQRMVARGEVRDRVGDAEQRADEVVEMRRQVDQQLGMVLALERVGRGPRGVETRREIAVGGRQMVAKQRVDADQAVTRVEVTECQPVRQVKLAHARCPDAAEGRPSGFI